MSRKECRACGHRMRPAGTKVADYPGTRKHATQGLCTPCRDREQRAIAKGLIPDIPPGFDINHARAALQGFITERNRRLGASA
jgi:hypothetical protein